MMMTATADDDGRTIAAGRSGSNVHGSGNAATKSQTLSGPGGWNDADFIFTGGQGCGTLVACSHLTFLFTQGHLADDCQQQHLLVAVTPVRSNFHNF